MTLLVYSYLIYVVISVVVTIWVARKLHHRGRPFLVQSFHGDEHLADSINDLLVVGFYLLNFGYVALALRYGEKPADLQGAIEFLSTKIGLVLVILAGMHFFNLLVFSQIGKRPAWAKGSANASTAPRLTAAYTRRMQGENPFHV